MKRYALFLLMVMTLLGAGLACAPDDSWARLGGGRSFGGSPAMRSPAPAPAPSRPYGTQQQRPMNQSSAAQASRPGVGGMGAMGGLFGGLLAGTMLGSLLGGGGTGAGGGIGFLDIILFGALIWFGLKFFRRMSASRREQQTEGAYTRQNYGYGSQSTYDQSSMQRTTADGSAWDRMRSTTGGNGYGQQGDSMMSFGTPSVPDGFDAEEFLRGAKMAYTRLQESWDRRDLNDIAQFATPTVMQELERQNAEDPNPSRTELLMVNAQIMNVTNDGPMQRAQVFFDVMMREDPRSQEPTQAREIWHFMRTLPNGTWKLDGIQQTY